VVGCKCTGLNGSVFFKIEDDGVVLLSLSFCLPIFSWMQSSLHPLVQTEWQLLYICHLVGPLLQRLTNERPKALLEVVMEVYRLLQSVDRHQAGLFQHSDPLCDFLYPLTVCVINF